MPRGKWLPTLCLLLSLSLAGCGDDGDTYLYAAPEPVVERCDIPEEHHVRNPYTGQGSYSIGLCDGALEVTLTLNLVGDPVSDETRAVYREEIEGRWSTGRFEVPIVFRVVWSDVDPDKTITVVDGWGVRWHTSRWYTRGRMDAVAHEAGHYIGLFDEYGGGDAQGFDGGSSNGDRPWHPPGLMHTSWREPLDYYYDGLLLWYRDRRGVV